MLEKWLATVGAVTLSCAWGAGFVWAQGGFAPPIDTSVVSQESATTYRTPAHGHGNATPAPSPSAAPIKLRPKPSETPEPLRQVAAARVPVQSSTDLAAAGTIADTSGATGQTRSSVPAQTTPSDTGTGAGTGFTMATFNLIGSSHTAKGGHSPGMASGVERMPGALQILAQHQVSVAGLQEFQPDQRQAFQRLATGWAMYPGLSMGRKAGENSVAWRTDTWDLVKPGLVNITRFNGRERPMPYVLLKNKQTGKQACFSTFHNPANIGGNIPLAHRGDQPGDQAVQRARGHRHPAVRDR